MSVYTSISQAEAEQFLSQYKVGKLSQLIPIANGADNSNYYLTTDKQSFVLTIFKHINFNELPYFLAIISRAGQALPVAMPIPDIRGKVIQTIADKLSVLLPKFSGHHVTPTPIHCTEIGKFLGRFHQTFYDFELARDNPRPPHAVCTVQGVVKTFGLMPAYTRHPLSYRC